MERQLKQVKIVDTTLRDGEQTPMMAFMPWEKLEIAHQLDRLGVDVIEAGFAATHPIASQAISDIAREVRRPVIGVLARAVPGDVDAAWEALKEGGAENPRIHVFISSSEVHQMHQLRKSGNQVIEMAVNAVRRAKGYCPDVEFSPMDATRTNRRYLYALLESVIQAGATTINIPDTVGYAQPAEFGRLIKGIFKNVPSIYRAEVSVHCHDDLGQASANSLAAVRAGVHAVEGCINGLGERAGNTRLEEVIMAIDTRPDFYRRSTGIQTELLVPTSELVEVRSGIKVAPNTPVVGINAFIHESGIHQDGVKKNASTYEIMQPKKVGRFGEKYSLGPTSGTAGFEEIVKGIIEGRGIHVTEDQLSATFAAWKGLAWTRKDVSEDQELARRTILGIIQNIVI